MKARFGWIIALPLLLAPLYAQSPKVLVLNSYHDGFAWSDGIMRGISAALGEADSLYIEYLDSKRFPYATVAPEMRDLLARKYADTTFAAAITADDNALRFMLEYHRELFPDVPVVFCGLNDRAIDLASYRSWLTGLYERNDFTETIEAALRLFPETSAVLVVTDNSTSGLAQEETLSEIASDQFPELAFRFLNADRAITLERVQKAVRMAEPHTIVYFSDLYLDGRNEYQDYRTYLQPLTAESGIPFFSHSEFFLGYGIIGGKINAGIYQGEYAAGVVKRPLSGADPAAIPIDSASPNLYIFDTAVLERFSVPLRRLPEESELINQNSTGLTLLLRWLIPLGAGLIFFASLSLAFYITIRRRLEAERRLAYEQGLFSALLDNIPDFIYFKDRDCRILKINSSLAEFYDLAHPDEALGKSDEDFYSPRMAEQARRKELNILASGEPLINYEEFVERPQTGGFWLASTKLPLRDAYGSIIGTFGLSRDITERKRHTQEIERSLEEKNILLREINHRVKNNLAIISSLIALQERESENRESAKILEELRGRIYSIALVHERLYRSENFSSISVGDYLADLTGTVMSIFADAGPEIDISIDAGNIVLPLDTAVPLGLILNELLTNSVKHAFPSGPTAERRIAIEGSRLNGELIFTIRDNGAGYPQPFQPDTATGLGFTLIQALLAQIEGRITVENREGAWSRITLPAP